MAILTHEQIDPRALEALVHTSGDGAVVTFVGTTRDSFEGKGVVELFYEAYEPMALAQLEEIEHGPDPRRRSGRDCPSPGHCSHR